jgi:hypothetical protein
MRRRKLFFHRKLFQVDFTITRGARVVWHVETTHVARMIKYSTIVPKIMEPKGYKMINTFDMSAAFPYDTATQMDGMHVIGPPMKMVVTKLLHQHMCVGVVEGSRV